MLKPIFVLALITFFCVGAAVADICVRDDSGADVCLSKPAQRIIALSPGATELIYAAGGGDQVIAAVSYCDYPEAAKALPRVGSYNRFDQEAILAQKPDLLIAWIEGNPAEQLAKLKSLGLTIYYTQLNDFDDVSSSLERLGKLAGSETQAKLAADKFRAGIAELEDRYSQSAPVTVFQQIWSKFRSHILII